MVDILRLRDLGWLALQLGWGGLALFFATPLQPRAGRLSRIGLVSLACIGGPALVRYFCFPTIALDFLLGLFGSMTLFLLLKRVDWRTAFYGGLALQVIRELTQVLSYDLLTQLLLMPLGLKFSAQAWNLLHTALSLCIGLGLIPLFHRWIFRHDKTRFSWGQMALNLLPFLAYAYARNFYFYLRETQEAALPDGLQLRMGILLLLVGFSCLTVAILADNIMSAKLQQEELRRMEDILQKQRENYLSQKAASDAVRQKYHDMKHYLLALRTGGTERPVQVRLAGEIEEILGPLEGDLDTGNEYLDVVLAEKIALCRRQGIKLVPFVDGSRLGFIDGLDLCMVVGNALDNAVDAVQELPLERRIIHIKISTVHEMALLAFQNYYSTPPEKDDQGFYRTSKGDTENHGYGLRGISQAVEKYGGTVATSADGESFTLSILIPLPEAEPQ